MGHFYRTTFDIGSGGTLQLKRSELESSTGMCVCFLPHYHVIHNYQTFSVLKIFFSPFSTAAKEAGTDNRNIVDDGKSQKLTRDDIEMLKEQGLKGQVHPLSSTYC